MAKQERQKLKTLILHQTLLEQTDENHAMGTKELIDILDRHGVSAERKSIYNDFQTLRDFGVDVQCRKGKEGGWFVGDRPFELPELKLLVDAVQSCKFITRKKSDALIKKLESLTSVHQASKLRRQVYVDRRVKSMNEGVYYTIDTIHAALGSGNAVSFQYYDYNVKKERVLRREGKRYNIFPKGLIWDNQNYYLVGWDSTNGEIRSYRVDKMLSLNQTGLKPSGEAAKPVDMARYTATHFGMFGGTEARVTLLCDNTMVGVVLDRFGQEISLIPNGDHAFITTVDAVVSPQFYGWLMGVGENITIQGPQWAVEGYRNRLQEILGKHQPEEERSAI